MLTPPSFGYPAEVRKCEEHGSPGQSSNSPHLQSHFFIAAKFQV
jgi:hypothetical protein